MKAIIRILAAAAILIAILAPREARADDIKARMIKRAPVIADLLRQGVAGEKSDGALAFREGPQEAKKVIDEENADRKSVYETIAKEQGTTVKLVGERRAIQIAAKAKPGTWLQDRSGKWSRKK